MQKIQKMGRRLLEFGFSVLVCSVWDLGFEIKMKLQDCI
jgi:hypothetical protein